MFSTRTLSSVAVAGLTALSALSAQAELAEFYIGIDARTEGFGSYADNPNENRLTLLYAHGNHYHSIGSYTYTGDAADPVVLDTNGNNRLPETFTLQAPLELTPGTGAFAGLLTSNPQPGVHYSDMEMRSVHTLDGDPDDVEGLFGSSNGRWDDAFDAAHIHLEIVSLTPGLNLSTTSPLATYGIGDDVHVGDGDEGFSFTPVFWTDASATPGVYTAELRLVDEHGVYGDSGRFYIDYQVVPEPGSLGLLAVAGLAMLRRRR